MYIYTGNKLIVPGKADQDNFLSLAITTMDLCWSTVVRKLPLPLTPAVHSHGATQPPRSYG